MFEAIHDVEAGLRRRCQDCIAERRGVQYGKMLSIYSAPCGPPPSTLCPPPSRTVHMRALHASCRGVVHNMPLASLRTHLRGHGVWGRREALPGLSSCRPAATTS